MEIEADPKRGEMILKELGREKCKESGWPRERDDGGSDALAMFEKGEAARFRSCLVRLSYLAQDRVDLPEVVKGLPSSMANPIQKAMQGT